MSWLLGASLSFALPGHLALWTTFWNHTQSAYRPKWFLRRSGHFAIVLCGMLPIYLWLAIELDWHVHSTLAAAYMMGCVPLGIMALVRGLWRDRTATAMAGIRQRQAVLHSMEPPAAEQPKSLDWLGRLQRAIPGNQSLELECVELQIELPRLPRELDGLSIAHLTDLHFTGRIPRTYFDRVVDLVNDMQADVIAITGDLVDKPSHLPWIPAVLGRLSAAQGVYAIFGNHDLKHDLQNLRMLLREAGIVYLGGRWESRQIRGGCVVLAGNELPWISPAADVAELPDRFEQPHVRLLLAHTPDQFSWSRAGDFDLMLAGHTHGGQFCLPGIGPFISPSAVPLKYVSGTNFEYPTMLHVSRGVSGETPVRLNCRPEITKLILRCGTIG